MNAITVATELLEFATKELENARDGLSANTGVLQRTGWVIAFTHNGICEGIRVDWEEGKASKVSISEWPSQFTQEHARYNAESVKNGNGYATAMTASDFYLRRIKILEPQVKKYKQLLAKAEAMG